MRRLASFVSGRRTKWVLPVLWIVLAVVFSPLGSKVSDETKDETESFLPSSAESTQVTRLLNERFEGGQTVNGLIVYRRPGGLTPQDRRRIAADAGRAAQELPIIGKPQVPFQPGAPRDLVSGDGSVAYTVLTFRDDYKKLGDWGKELRKITGDGGGGLEVYVTGDAGIGADFEEVFGSIDGLLLGATALLVLVLLGLIYRAPLIAVIPLVVVGFAYTVAQGLIYLYAKSGATVSSNATGILVVLMFGVGTDYCLLLVSRYREELRLQRDKHDAMARAIRRVGPAILASGLTVAPRALTAIACSRAPFRPVPRIPRPCWSSESTARCARATSRLYGNAWRRCRAWPPSGPHSFPATAASPASTSSSATTPSPTRRARGCRG